MLSVSAEAQPEKTLVGLGRPLDAAAPAGLYEENLPESGIREVDEPDDEADEDVFSEHEADTRLESMPPGSAPDSSPLPDVSDLDDPFGEAELMPANWEDDDEEATRPQLFVPNHPSEPPPRLPGSRMADSEPPAVDVAAAVESWPRHEMPAAPVDAEALVASERKPSRVVDLPSSPFSSAERTRARGLDPRLSGMLAGAGLGAAASIGLVALLAWRAPAQSVPETTPVTIAPATQPAVVVEARAASQEETGPAIAELPAAPAAAPVAPSERRTTRASSSVTALPVKLEEETVVEGARGMLRVSSLPSAHVVLDGRPIGMTPKLVPVSAGEHTVLFVHPELGRRTMRVSVENDAKAEAFTRF